MTEKRKPTPPEAEAKTEGWEGLEEEAAGGALAPSPELEEAMREAAEAVAAHHAPRAGAAPAESAAGDLEQTREQLEAARAEIERLNDRYLRLQADFENTRRRGLKDRQEAHKYGHENLVKDLLATVDNLERAISHARSSDGGDFEAMLQGVELVHRDLLGALTKHGVSAIEADGATFDPSVHEAMAQEVEDSVPANTVIRVFEKGYALWDRLLRPARVVVSKPSGDEEGANRAPPPDLEVEE